MHVADEEMDEVVIGVLVDCASVSPPLDRSEIAQHVIDHYSSELRKRVYASLDRMVGRGRIVSLADAGEECRLRYDIPPGPGGRH